MRTPTTKHLRIVAEIAKSGKISSAANALGVTGPAVTLQLQQLEAMIGLPLFERDRRQMRPTAAGELLADCARQVDDRLKACVQALEDLSGLRSGRIFVGVVSTAKYFAVPALGGFRAAHLNFDLRLQVANRGEILRSLASLETDLAVMGRPPEDVKVECIELGDHPHVIIAARDHPLAGAGRIPLERLADETLLMREQGSGTRILTERLLDEAGIRPRNAMDMTSNETIKQSVMAGLGVALISGHTIAAEIQSGRLVILDVDGLPVMRKWYAVRHKEKRMLPPAAALWDFLVVEGKRYLPQVIRPSGGRRASAGTDARQRGAGTEPAAGPPPEPAARAHRRRVPRPAPTTPDLDGI